MYKDVGRCYGCTMIKHDTPGSQDGQRCFMMHLDVSRCHDEMSCYPFAHNQLVWLLVDVYDVMDVQ